MLFLESKLPDYVVSNKGLLTLQSSYTKTLNTPTGVYADDLCLFRCLACNVISEETGERSARSVHRGLEKRTRRLFMQYRLFSKKDIRTDTFKRVELAELGRVECCFKMNINVYCLTGDQDLPAIVVRRSLGEYNSTANLNLWGQHFSYIHDMGRYSRAHKCSKCNKMWHTAYLMHRHERTCDRRVKYTYKGGVQKSSFLLPEVAPPATLTSEGFLNLLPKPARSSTTRNIAQ